MPRQRRPDRRAIAVNQIEHTCRVARFVDQFGIDLGGQRRVFGRLQHTGRPRRKRRNDLQRDLVDGPVPRRDQAANADWLAADDIAIGQDFFFVMRLECGNESLQMAKARIGLRVARHGGRGTHFHRDRRRQIAQACARQLCQLAQQGKAFVLCGQGKRLERCLGGSDGAVHVNGIPKRYRADLRIGGRRQDRHGFGRVGGNPCAIDIEFIKRNHCIPPRGVT